MKRHEEKVHGHLKQTCDICNEVCLSIRLLASHVAKIHCIKDSKGRYVCTYCSVSKRKEYRALSYHIMNKHFDQPNYRCNKCNKGFDDGSFVGH